MTTTTTTTGRLDRPIPYTLTPKGEQYLAARHCLLSVALLPAEEWSAEERADIEANVAWDAAVDAAQDADAEWRQCRDHDDWVDWVESMDAAAAAR